MSTANLLYTDTEDALRDSVRRLFADRCKPEVVTTLYDQPDVDFTDVWKTLAVELGLAGLLVPESLGGAGASTREAASALYLSPKTIEYHLRHVYLKLGVNSRAALAAALRPDQSSPASSSALRDAPESATGA